MPHGCFLGEVFRACSFWDEGLWQTQDSVERLYLSAAFVMAQCPPNEQEEVARVRLDYASLLRLLPHDLNLDKQQKRSGWLDGTKNSWFE